VYVPLNTPSSYAATKRFARELAHRLAERDPDRVVDRSDRSVRPGQVFVDWGQNDATKSTVAPYSLRARFAPTVSTPVTWDEVDAGRAAPFAFVPHDVLDRLDRLGDLFAPVATLEQELPLGNMRH
jgi:bifunctional non-homologous end joining protein LigD